MLKSSTPYIVYTILSILVVAFNKYINDVILLIVSFYEYINSHLDILFSQSNAGILSRNSTALVISPLIITGIPALAYYSIKRSKMPYFIEITWLAWFVIVLSNLLTK